MKEKNKEKLQIDENIQFYNANAKTFAANTFSVDFVYSGDIEPSARGFRATITDE